EADGVAGGVLGGASGGAIGGMVGSPGGQALELSQVERAPQVLESVRPRYPASARRRRIEGRVVVRVIVGADGVVEKENTRVLASAPGLDEAAIDAVNRWRFSPALGAGGRPVRVIIDIPIQFSLR
ncbi:MAG: energy transducer TonB, partial [Myxococcaceae bacterium]